MTAAFHVPPVPRIDLTDYRGSAEDRRRVADLMARVPTGLTSALDAGARDGHLSRLLCRYVAKVTALDIQMPTIEHEGISCVQGSVTSLPFADGSFDLALCAEVLELVPAVEQACAELGRVSRRFLLIGVPFRQDIRLGRTTCEHCAGHSPPWGHVNSFDEKRLEALFPGYRVTSTGLIGSTREVTNGLSAALMNFAGNPYGTYEQEESCIHCGHHPGHPGQRTLLQQAATRMALTLRQIQVAATSPRAKWIHQLLERR